MYWNIDGMFGRWRRVVGWQAGLAGGQLDAAAGRGSAGVRHGGGLLRAALRHGLLNRSHHGAGPAGEAREAEAPGPQGRHAHAFRWVFKTLQLHTSYNFLIRYYKNILFQGTISTILHKRKISITLINVIDLSTEFKPSYIQFYKLSSL